MSQGISNVRIEGTSDIRKLKVLGDALGAAYSRMPLGQSQDIPQADPGGWVRPRF
jgi:hypothetical protein